MVATSRAPSLAEMADTVAASSVAVDRRALQVDAGDRIGDYVVEHRESSGGFGTVYRAHHVVDRRTVALKVLHPDLANSPGLVRRFRREVMTVNRIRHPNIVEVYELGELRDGRPFFAMEWIDGHTLETELHRRGALSVAEALAALENVADALAAAHELGVVHRDLKADNVMVVPRGDWFDVKLIDFGIAKLLDPESPEAGLTSTGSRLGTPYQMAPEQILGGAIDCRTDVYALGTLLYRLLTGRYPFEGTSALEIEEQHLAAPPPRASDLAPVPVGVDQLIARCMAKQPADRFPGVEAVIAELRAAAVGPTDRPSRRLRAQPRPALAAYAVVRPTADDDDAMDAAEAVSDELARELDALGFDLVSCHGTGTLAVMPLSGHTRVGQRERMQLVARLSRALARLGTTLDVEIALALHRGTVISLVVNGRIEYIGGELLQVPAWTMGMPRDGLVATPQAVADLAPELAIGPVDGSDWLCVAARATDRCPCRSSRCAGCGAR